MVSSSRNAARRRPLPRTAVGHLADRQRDRPRAASTTLRFAGALCSRYSSEICGRLRQGVCVVEEEHDLGADIGDLGQPIRQRFQVAFSRPDRMQIGLPELPAAGHPHRNREPLGKTRPVIALVERQPGREGAICKGLRRHWASNEVLPRPDWA